MSNPNFHTPTAWFEAARLIMGSIDLDPATDHVAARGMQPARWYTPQEDGLTLPWPGNVFINPPGGKVWQKWAGKANTELRAGRAKQLFWLGFNADQLRAFHLSEKWIFPGKELVLAIPRKRIAFTHPQTLEKMKNPEHSNYILMVLNPENVECSRLQLGPVCEMYRPLV